MTLSLIILYQRSIIEPLELGGELSNDVHVIWCNVTLSLAEKCLLFHKTEFKQCFSEIASFLSCSSIWAEQGQREEYYRQIILQPCGSNVRSSRTCETSHTASHGY